MRLKVFLFWACQILASTCGGSNLASLQNINSLLYRCTVLLVLPQASPASVYELEELTLCLPHVVLHRRCLDVPALENVLQEGVGLYDAQIRNQTAYDLIQHPCLQLQRTFVG